MTDPAEVRPTGLAVAYGAHGLKSLVWNRTPLLADGAFTVERAVFREPDGTEIEADTKPVNHLHGPPLLLDYGAWSINVWYNAVTVRDRLTLTITVNNKTPDDTLTGLWLRPLVLRFPASPTPESYPAMSFLPGNPRYHWYDWGGGTCVFVNEDVTRPLIAGFEHAGHEGYYNIRLRTNPWRGDWFASFPYDRVGRPIPAGCSDRFVASLRFGSSIP